MTELQVTTLYQCIVACTNIIVGNTYPPARTVALLNLVVVPRNPNDPNDAQFLAGLQNINNQSLRTALCNLRSLFLERPVNHIVNHVDGIPVFQIQIGQEVPLNLHHIGPAPQPNEIKNFLEEALDLVIDTLQAQPQPAHPAPQPQPAPQEEEEEEEQNQPPPDNRSTLEYCFDESVEGAKNAFTAPFKMVFHPWQTVENLINNISHPVQTIENIATEIHQHPIRSLVNVLTSKYLMSLVQGPGDGGPGGGDLASTIKTTPPVTPVIGMPIACAYQAPTYAETMQLFKDATEAVAPSVITNIAVNTTAPTTNNSTNTTETNPQDYSNTINATLKQYTDSYAQRKTLAALVEEALNKYKNEYIATKCNHAPQANNNTHIQESSLPQMRMS